MRANARRSQKTKLTHRELKMKNFEMFIVNPAYQTEIENILELKKCICKLDLFVSH